VVEKQNSYLQQLAQVMALSHIFRCQKPFTVSLILESVFYR
jgi:hypothetical protein